MAELDKFKQAGALLQDVDLVDIVTSLALGIAKAQEALDDNSIKQLSKLSQLEINGQSLLQLGFLPAFYVFDFADVSASISLKMRENKSVDAGIEADLTFAKTKGYSKEHLDFLEEKNKEVERKEYKSSRSFLMKSSESETITVQNKTAAMDSQKGCVSRVEDYADQLREAEGITVVDVDFKSSSLVVDESTDVDVIIRNIGGYITIVLPQAPSNDLGVVKLKGYTTYPTTTSIDIATSTPFLQHTDFQTTFPLAVGAHTGGSTYGYSGGEYWLGSAPGTPKKLEVFFDHGKYNFDLGYSKDSPSDNNLYENTDMDKRLDHLVLILKKDPAAKVHIIGHTDNTGPEGNTASGNIKLGKQRAVEIQNYLYRKGVPNNQVSVESKGESLDNATAPSGEQKDVRFRKAELVLSGADYIVFDGGNFSKTNSTPNFSANGSYGYIYKEGVADTPVIDNILFNHFGTAYNFSSSVDAEDVQNHASFAESKYDFEYLHGMAYLLHQESTLSFTTYSLETEEITMVENTNSSQESSGAKSSYYISENQNSKTRILKDAENVKNPSTLAVGVSVDMRTSRQFEVSMEGNASFSARLKSVPLPDAFKDFIQTEFSANVSL